MAKPKTPPNMAGTDIRNFFGGAKKVAKHPTPPSAEESPEKKAKTVEAGRLKRHHDHTSDDDEKAIEESRVDAKASETNGLKRHHDQTCDDDEEAAKEEGEAKKSPAKKQKNEWSDGVPYARFAECCGAVEAIRSRLEITEKVKDLCEEILRKSPDDLACILYLLGNKVAPAYENVELGIGEALLHKAIAAACGRSPSQVKADAASLGDLGEVAEAARGKQRTLNFGAKPKPLSARRVLSEFRLIAETTGSKSQDAKIGKITKLLTAATPVEAKYIVRALGGKMRIHLGEKTVHTALGHAVVDGSHLSQSYDENNLKEAAQDTINIARATLAQYVLKKKTVTKEARLEAAVEIVKSCYAECPSLDLLARAAQNLPLWRWIELCRLTPGVPVAPMCAKAEKDVRDVLKRFEKQAFTCEYKYDGERLQAHRDAHGQVRLFSRNCADTTKKWPDVVAYVQAAAKNTTTEFILDAEVVAVNKITSELQAFQILSTRKKEVEDLEQIQVPVIVFAFDLISLNGNSLLRQPLRKRRTALREAFEEDDHDFRFATSVDVETSVNEEDERAVIVQEAMEAAVKAKVEGLMIKTLETNATYEPTRRSLNWLKLKKDYLLDFAGDSFDLCVVGGYHGKGKRTGAFGSYLLACYDPEDGTFQTVCKVATGFSDEDLKQLDELFADKQLSARPRPVIVSDDLAKDIVWFQPSVVFEIRAADLSLSSTHKGALGRVQAGRGVGLRFPRFERLRTDKSAHLATTSEQVLETYLQQDSIKGTSNADAADDSDEDGFL